MSHPDLDHIRYVTRYFPEFCGFLLMVPSGLMMMGSGLGSLGRGDERTSLLSIACQVGAVCLFLWARKYYRRRFGEVEPQTSSFFPDQNQNTRVALILGISGFTVFVFSVTSAPAFGRFVCFSFGAMLLGMWLWRGGRLSQIHYLVLGAPLLGLVAAREPDMIVLSALFRLGLLPPGSYDYSNGYSAYALYLGIAMVPCGAAWLVAGLLNHWQLVRTMGPLAGPAPELAAVPQVEE